MTRESLASIIKREYGAANPKPEAEPQRRSGGISDLAGDDLVVGRALRRFESAKERAARQREELDKAVAPARAVHPSRPEEISSLTDAELAAHRDAIFKEEASREVDGYFALSPEERAAVVPDMDEDELSDYLDRPSYSFSFDDEESYEDDDEDAS